MSATRAGAPATNGARETRRRAVLTVLATLLVVMGEFALLTVVYQRGAPTRSERVAVATLSGEAAATGSPAWNVQVAVDTASTVGRLRDLGLSGTRLDALAKAGDALAAAPSSPTATAKLRGTLTRLSDQLAARQRDIDREALGIFAALLVVASVGWMVWFRNLVRRHRDLERSWTEQKALAEGEERLAAMVRNAADTVAVCDATGAITFVSPSVHALLGVSAEAIIGRRWTDWVLAEDAGAVAKALSVDPGAEGRITARLRREDGRVIHAEGTVTNHFDDPLIGGLLITARDVTSRVELERELWHQARHDALTGLPNRQSFAESLAATLHRPVPVEASGSVLVLVIDVDDFHNVNDGLGHGVGDQVLRAAGSRIQRLVRPGDLVARIGGDQFAVLMPDADATAAHAVAVRVLDAISEPMTIDGQNLAIHACIGVAEASPGETTGDATLRNADVAVSLAKQRGKARVARYEPVQHAEVLERLALHADLQRAIANDELRLNYQPTVDLGTGVIVGFEALVRWAHPQRGLIAPARFIPLAEQTGLIRALGSWVLRHACAAAVELGRTTAPGRRPVGMSVNVAAQQLAHPNFVNEVLHVLTTTGLSPDRLTLEITESVLLHDVSAVIERLAVLRRVGIRIAIDDFGTGYSSLAYLRKLPLDVLKVDKEFIDRVTTDEHDAALTHAILEMSAALNLSTVAEGVEHPEQAGWLAQAHCTFGQGYLWSRPVPLEQAVALLGAQRAADEPEATVLEMVRPGRRGSAAPTDH